MYDVHRCSQTEMFSVAVSVEQSIPVILIVKKKGSNLGFPLLSRVL